MSQVNKKGILYAFMAALCYAISSPVSKLLLNYIPPTLMAGFLYLGAGLCMLVIFVIKKIKGNIKKEKRLSKKDIFYVIGMVLLDIAAPILLMFGLTTTTAANVSLLNNFEIVMTSLIAFIFFKEKISLRVWLGIIIITIACLLLACEDLSAFKFSYGSLLVIGAAICWGLENNCTRMISNSDPLEIVLIKGLCSGTGSLIIGLCIGERIALANLWIVALVLALGIIAYGLSIFIYIYAQRYIGAAKTSAYYAINPFIATFLSLIIFQDMPSYIYYIALFLMIIGAYLTSSDKPFFKRRNRE